MRHTTYLSARCEIVKSTNFKVFFLWILHYYWQPPQPQVRIFLWTDSINWKKNIQNWSQFKNFRFAFYLFGLYFITIFIIVCSFNFFVQYFKYIFWPYPIDQRSNVLLILSLLVSLQAAIATKLSFFHHFIIKSFQTCLGVFSFRRLFYILFWYFYYFRKKYTVKTSEMLF